MALTISPTLETQVNVVKSELKTRLGGVTRESAEAAIDKLAAAAQKYLAAADEKLLNTITAKDNKFANSEKLQKETFDMYDASCRANLALTKERDSLAADNELYKNKISKMDARIAAMLAYKPVKTNADGSRVFVKMNLNGAKAEKVVNSDGKKIKENIELADGTFRHIKFNPETGYAKEVITNANPDGNVIKYSFDKYGHKTNTELLNVKNSSNKVKPKVISTRHINNPFGYGSSDNPYFVERKMSDGTTEIITISGRTNKVRGITRYPQGVSSYNKGYAYQDIDITNERVYIVNSAKDQREQIIIKYTNGVVAYTPYSVTANEYGQTIFTNRIVMPKSSPVKRIDTQNIQGTSVPDNTKMKMKNGDVYVFTDWESPQHALDSKPTKCVKIAHDGSKTTIDKESMLKLLNSYHPHYNKNLLN